MKASEIVKMQNELKQKRMKELEKASARQREIDNGTLIPENHVTLKEVERTIKETAENSNVNWVTYDGQLQPLIIESLKNNGFSLSLITNKSSYYVPNFSKMHDNSYHVYNGVSLEKVQRFEPSYEKQDFYNTYTLIYWGDEIPAALTVEHEKVVEL